MACDSESMAARSNLNHVYFFMSPAPGNHTDVGSITSTTNGSKHDQSRASSPGSNGASSATLTMTSTSSSEMNPLAEEFKPHSVSIAPPPIATGLYELRQTPDKGLGLFAISLIKRGTLIICEEPLLKIRENALPLVLDPYRRLSDEEKAVYDSLHSFEPAHLDFASAVNQVPTGPFTSKSDVPTLTRAMSIFAANSFQATPPGSLAVYAAASRLNHSCVPNVHHSSNPTLGRLTVYAVRDIQPSEELLTNYIGGKAVYQLRAQRLEHLRSNYGFTCQCPACSDRSGYSDGRRELMGAIAWGLMQFQQRGAFNLATQHQPHPFIPANLAAALRQAEDLIGVLMAEGLITIELTKAYRTASTLALKLQDFDRALEYARNEVVVERNCLGEVVDDLWAIGAAAGCWVQQISDIIAGGGVGVAGKVKNAWKRKKGAGKSKMIDAGSGLDVGARNDPAKVH